MKHTVICHDVQQAHKVLTESMMPWVKSMTMAGHKLQVIAKPLTRTIDQNAAQWPYLDAFSKQLKWPVNGGMVDMTPEEWKDVLTAAFNRDTVRVAMGLDGGVVMLGMRTSEMTKPVFSEWLEFLKATAAIKGVKVYD